MIHCMRALSPFPLILFSCVGESIFGLLFPLHFSSFPYFLCPSTFHNLLISYPALQPSFLLYLPSPPVSLHMDEVSPAGQALAGVLTHPSRAVLLLLHKLFRNKEGGNSQTNSILCRCFSFFLSLSYLLGFVLSTLSSLRDVVCI